MNENKIDFQPARGLNGDSTNSEFGNRFSLYFDINQFWNTGSCSQTAAMAGGAEHPPYAVAEKSSTTTIMGGFASPSYAFYATERCMGFQQYEGQVGNPSSTSSQLSNPNDQEFPLYQSDPGFELSNTLQAMVKSQLTGNQYRTSTSPEKSSKFLPVQQHDAALVKRTSSSNLYKGNQDHTVALGPYNFDVAQLGFSSSQQEKLSPTTVSGNSCSNGTVVSSKTRIRWTQDLHEKFVECVNCLGGAEKATPKAILKLMDSDGLTIFHVKSHLQKYRIAKYMPDSAQGKSDKRTHVEDVHHLDAKTGLQIREALQLQLDVQRRLHEQLEIQRKLQLRIEEQGRQLKMMFDQQQKTSNMRSTTNDDTPNGLKDVEPSISEGSGNSFFPSKIS